MTPEAFIAKWKAITRAQLLVQFSESPENERNIIPAIKGGIWTGIGEVGSSTDDELCDSFREGSARSRPAPPRCSCSCPGQFPEPQSASNLLPSLLCPARLTRQERGAGHPINSARTNRWGLVKARTNVAEAQARR